MAGSAPSTAYIRLFAPVDNNSMIALLSICDQIVARGTGRIHLLISTPGGSVFHGISVYNYLRGLPVELVTHNFGAVDSTGLVVFSAGKTRLSVPNARILMHGVSATVPGPAALTEDQLQESLKSLRIDASYIARIIAEHSRKTEKEIHEAMLVKTTFDPKEAIAFGLVDRIEPVEIPAGTNVYAIQKQDPK